MSSATIPTTTAVPPTSTMSKACRAVSARPITSKAYSTVSPVISFTASTGSRFDALTTSVAPKCLAISSLLSSMSTAMMCAAPAMRQPWMTFSPTPPQPITTTVAPPGTLAVYSAAPTPVMTPQPTSAASAQGMSSGIFSTPLSTVSIFSANDPTDDIMETGFPSQLSRPRVG